MAEALWKTERMRRQVWRPSGRVQRAGAVRSWDVRSERLCGLERVVRREDAVERSLRPKSVQEWGVVDENGDVPGRVLLVGVGLEGTEQRGEKSISRHDGGCMSVRDIEESP